jgi:dGTPase
MRTSRESDTEKTIWQARRSGNIESRPKSGYRSEYVRDRARIIHSAAFRRLQAKTQVLGIGEGDFHRTRLTHSMEVAQIARGIVRHLVSIASKTAEWRSWLPDQNLIEAIALAHDLGHPPFGHGGEIALNHVMAPRGGFEGNGQTLRLLSKLEAHTEGYGLDVTRRTLLGVLKYPVPYKSVVRSVYPETTDPKKVRRSDWKPPKCFLSSERDVVQWILEPFSSSDRRRFTKLGKKPTSDAHGKSACHAFDTSIMELADDIAYGVHDFEDAVALRLLDKEDWTSLAKGINRAWSVPLGIEPSDNFQKALFGLSSASRKHAIGGLVNALIVSVSVIEQEVFTHPLLRFQATLSAPAKKLLDDLQELVNRKVIKTPQVQTIEYRGQQLIMALFAAIESDPPRFLKESFRQFYEKAKDDAGKGRVICDYISGMTDEYATRLYERLFVPRQGHVFDRL